MSQHADDGRDPDDSDDSDDSVDAVDDLDVTSEGDDVQGGKLPGSQKPPTLSG